MRTNIYLIIDLLFFRLVVCAIFLFSMNNVMGQRYLQVEKHHKKVKLKYTAGDDITFRLRQSDQWLTSVLTDIDFDNNILFFTNLTVPLDSINGIKSHKPLVAPELGMAVLRSGLSGLGTSLLYTLAFQPSNAKEFLLFFGGVSASGLGLTQLSKKRRVFDIGNKFNLRITDLNIYILKLPPVPGG